MKWFLFWVNGELKLRLGGGIRVFVKIIDIFSSVD